nr:hypothetical protein [Psychrobacter sp. JCM 18901]
MAGIKLPLAKFYNHSTARTGKKKYNANALCKAVRNQLESVTRPEMTNKFTMREMIEKTLEVYQSLHDAALAEEQAEADAIAVRRIKRSLKKASKPALNVAVKNIEPVAKNPKIKLTKEKSKTTDNVDTTETTEDNQHCKHSSIS